MHDENNGKIINSLKLYHYQGFILLANYHPTYRGRNVHETCNSLQAPSVLMLRYFPLFHCLPVLDDCQYIYLRVHKEPSHTNRSEPA